MSIQSTKVKAYGENEQLIFRTLSAYTAIALDNAVAYNHLRDAKSQLAEQEKLAALGSMVAGVAHELNTPLGNCLVTTSAIQGKTAEVQAAVASGTLRRSTLDNYFSECEEGLLLVMRGLRVASDLVQSFKQVAVDRASEQRRTFDLLHTSQEVIATTNHNVQSGGFELIVDIPSGIVIDCYPGPYGQVLASLISNAMLHGFDQRSHGTMELRAQLKGASEVEIFFSDNGHGIAKENLGRVFDPFFTTKFGKGGSGLGLSVSYNIMTGLFGGTFEVKSTPGQGTTFVIKIPVVAPEASWVPHGQGASKVS